MLPSEHSRIEDHSNPNHSLRSDLQSLEDLRELLPHRPPVRIIDNYTIRSENAPSDPDGSSSSPESEEGKQLLQKVITQTHQILKIKQQLYYYKTEFFRVTQLYNELRDNLTKSTAKQSQLKDSINHLQRQCEEVTDGLSAQLAARDKELQILKQQNVKLKATSVTIDLGVQNHLNEEVQHQSRVIMELMMKNEKILKINAFLKEELAIAEGKLVRLQEEAQDKTCGLLLDNLERLKENCNLINQKASKSISQWEGSSHQRKMTPHPSALDPLNRQQTIKLASNRQSIRHFQEKVRKESTTLEKERPSISLPYNEKLRPLQEPKPHRKTYVGQLSKKYPRRDQSGGQ